MTGCDSGRIEIVRQLLAAGVGVEARDVWKQTALHYATSRGKIEIVRELILRHNANMFAVDKDGRTPFDLTRASWRSDAAVDPLLQIYANKLTQDHGRLALQELLKVAKYSFADEDEEFHPPLNPLRIKLPLGKLTLKHLRTLLHTMDLELIRNRDGTGKLPIHIACQTNAPVEVLSLLVEHDPTTLRIADFTGALPIHLLCGTTAGTDYASVRYLVEQGGVGTLAALNQQGAVPLHILSGSTDPPLRALQYLLQSFPGSAAVQTNAGQYPFMMAAAADSSSTSLSVIYDLVRAYPGSIVITPTHLVLQRTCMRAMVAVLKLFGFCLIVVLMLIVLTNPVGVETHHGIQQTALHDAASWGTSEMMLELILQRNANMFAMNGDGRTPFDDACSSEQTADVIDDLIEVFDNTLTHDHDRPARHELLKVAEYSFAEDKELFHPPLYPLRILLPLDQLTLKHLCYLLHTMDPELKRNQDDTGNFPIPIVCRTNAPVEVLTLTFELDPAALRIADSTGALPIHLLCGTNTATECASMRYLVEQDDVGTLAARNQQGSSPLHVLCGSTDPPLQVVQYLFQSSPESFLLDGDADAHHVDQDGTTALRHACKEGGSLEIVRLLVGAGVDVEARDQRQNNALHHAASNGRIELMLELILQHNANMFAADEKGRTPFDWACRREQAADVVSFLLEVYGNKSVQDHGSLALHLLMSAAEHSFSEDNRFHLPRNPFRIILPLGYLALKHFRTLLHTLDPDLVGNRGDTRNLPIHIACETNAPVQILALILELDHTTLRIANSTGALLNHLLFGTTAAVACTCVLYLVEQDDVGTLADGNRQGLLPLQLLCESTNPPLHVVQYLIQSLTESLAVQTNTGQYPFMIAAAVDSSSPSLCDL